LSSGVTAEDAANSAAEAAKDATKQAVEEVVDGAPGEQVLEQPGDGVEEVTEQVRSLLRDGASGAAENSARAAEKGKIETADSHGERLVGARHGFGERHKGAVGVGALLLDEVL
jgi:hypothetical protein